MPLSLSHAAIFLAALGASVFATAALSRGPIERDLERRAQQHLADSGIPDLDLLELSFQGRDCTVAGEVRSAEQRDAVEAALGGVLGIREVRSSIAVEPFQQPWLELVREETRRDDRPDSIRLEGLVPTGGARAEIVDAVRAAVGETPRVENRIEQRRRVEQPGWLGAAVPVAAKLLAVAEGGRLRLRDGELQLAGTMPDRASHRHLVELAEGGFAAHPGVRVAPELTVAPPPKPAGFQLAPGEGGKLVASGRLADFDTAGRLMAALRGSDYMVEDQIVVADDTLAAPWLDGLLLLLPSVLSEVRDPLVAVDSKEVRLHGELESEAMFEAIGALAEQTFPAPGFQVHNMLRVMAPPREAMVSVITFPNGQVQLKGLLADQQIKDQIVGAARDAAPDRDVRSDELQVDHNVLEAPWIEALVGVVPPFVREVRRGGLTIYSNILAVEAVIDSDRERDLIWAMTEHHFPDGEYRRVLELRFPEEVEGGIAVDAPAPEPGR